MLAQRSFRRCVDLGFGELSIKDPTLLVLDQVLRADLFLSHLISSAPRHKRVKIRELCGTLCAPVETLCAPDRILALDKQGSKARFACVELNCMGF